MSISEALEGVEGAYPTRKGFLDRLESEQEGRDPLTATVLLALGSQSLLVSFNTINKALHTCHDERNIWSFALSDPF